MTTENTVETESGDEVTYVGGRAIEQETSGETPVEGSDHGDELAEAKAAVKAALAEEAKREAKEVSGKERGEDGKFKAEAKDPVEKELETAKKALSKELKTTEPKEPKPVKDEADEDATALRKALSERKEAARYKAEAQAEVEKARNEARQMYQDLQRQQRELAQEKARMEVLRKDPIRAIRENGWDPEEFITDIAMDGTPEGQAKRAHRELQSQMAELRAWKQEQMDAVVRQKQESEVQERAQFRRSVEQQFLNAAATKTETGQHKNNHLVSMYKDDPAALIVQADLVAERYRQATGKEATFHEIAEYLEERAAKWYKSMSSGSAPQAGAPVTQGRPAQGSATGKRSLSPAGSSERRSLGAAVEDLDGDERRQAAIDAVRAALAARGER